VAQNTIIVDFKVFKVSTISLKFNEQLSYKVNGNIKSDKQITGYSIYIKHYTAMILGKEKGRNQ